MKYAQGGTMFCGFFTKESEGKTRKEKSIFLGSPEGWVFCAKLGKTVINNSQNKPT